MVQCTDHIQSTDTNKKEARKRKQVLIGWGIEKKNESEIIASANKQKKTFIGKTLLV